MKRVTDEMFEAMVEGGAAVPADLSGEDRRRLAEARAVRERLRAAFGGVRPGPELASRLRERLSVDARASAPAEAEEAVAGLRLRFPRAVWPILAAAAAVLVAAVSLSILLSPGDAIAAQQELALLHASHESPNAELFHDPDPAVMADHLKDRVGFEATVPPLAAGESVRGCCVSRFRREWVASYVLETEQGMVSIVVARVSPDALHFRHRLEREGRTVWACGFEECSMAGLPVGELFYYAIGEAPRDFLIDLLFRIVPPEDL